MSEPRIYANTFQTFNSYVDRAMEHLTDSELRVLLFATRHIMGWQDRIQSRSASLSLSMFVEGFAIIHDDGSESRYGGCGVGRNAVSKALNSLERFGLLERVGYVDDKGQQWRLAEHPDWQALEARSAEKAQADKRHIEKANSMRGSTVRRYGGVVPSDGMGVVPSDGMGVVPSDGMGVVPSDELNQTQDQTQDQTQYGAPDGAPVGGDPVFPVKANGARPKKASGQPTRKPPNPISAPPLPVAPDPQYRALFAAAAEHIFGISSPEELKTLDESEGVGGRIGMIASWLARKNDRFKLNGGRKPAVIGFISAPASPRHVADFAGWYKSAHQGASLPRDVAKFVEYWREWASTRRGRSPPKPTESVVDRDRKPPTEAELAEMRRIRSGAGV